jgi:ribonuclease HII
MTRRWVLGVDEVGWGAIAGEIAVGAFLAPETWVGVEGLNDSKRLSPQQRLKVKARLYAECATNSAFWSVCAARPGLADSPRLGDALRAAACRAMKTVLASFYRDAPSLRRSPVHVILDGSGGVLTKDALPTGSVRPLTAGCVVKADATVKQVMAASVLAKEQRDGRLLLAGMEYPDFSWAAHHGYPTQAHLRELAEHGPTPIHRPWTAPVKRWNAEQV